MNRPFYVSCMAVHKCEANHLREWLEYHLLVGIEHFVLLDNNEPPCLRTDAILAPYLAAGLVENFRFPGLAVQCPAYSFGLAHIRGKTRWLAVIDIDEFIFPRHHDTLPELLRKYEHFGGLVINWCCFGTSGWKDPPPSVVRDVIHRPVDDFAPNHHVKTIAQVDRTIEIYAHSCRFVPNAFAVNEHGSRNDGIFNVPPSYDWVRINHYVLRSEADFYIKGRRGNVDGAVDKCTREFFDNYNRSDVCDRSLHDRCGATLCERCVGNDLLCPPPAIETPAAAVVGGVMSRPPQVRQPRANREVYVERNRLRR